MTQQKCYSSRSITSLQYVIVVSVRSIHGSCCLPWMQVDCIIIWVLVLGDLYTQSLSCILPLFKHESVKFPHITRVGAWRPCTGDTIYCTLWIGTNFCFVASFSAVWIHSIGLHSHITIPLWSFPFLCFPYLTQYAHCLCNLRLYGCLLWVIMIANSIWLMIIICFDIENIVVIAYCLCSRH